MNGYWKEVILGAAVAAIIAMGALIKGLNDDSVANEYKFVNIHNELMTITTSLETIHSKLNKSEFYIYKKNQEEIDELRIQLLHKEIENLTTGGNNGTKN